MVTLAGLAPGRIHRKGAGGGGTLAEDAAGVGGAEETTVNDLDKWMGQK